MKLALVGYGKMGKAIEKIAVDRGHDIVARIGRDSGMDDCKKADAAIEFSVPSAAQENLLFLAENGIPTACGTTGWLEHQEEVEKAFLQNNSAFLYASNFSVGVNLFFKLNAFLANMMKVQPDYKVAMEEIHHTQKLDAPSGTAITLAEGIIENHSDYSGWKLDGQAPDEVPIKAIREEQVPGTHIIRYHSAIDEIKISHEAFNRSGFALGAVLAAEFLAHKKGIFTMNEVLNI